MCSALATWREPWNITCSKRWAKPVLPGCSCFEPTSYQTLIATTGARWSSATIRRRPLGSRSSLKATVGTRSSARGSHLAGRNGRRGGRPRSYRVGSVWALRGSSGASPAGGLPVWRCVRRLRAMSTHLRRSHLAFPIVVLVLAALALPLSVAAHAELVTASPRTATRSSVTHRRSTQPTARISTPTAARSVCSIPSGTRVARGGVVADGGPKEMFIRNLPSLAPGVYTVRSTTKSADDGDIERVTWSFTVTAPPPSRAG